MHHTSAEQTNRLGFQPWLPTTHGNDGSASNTTMADANHVKTIYEYASIYLIFTSSASIAAVAVIV